MSQRSPDLISATTSFESPPKSASPSSFTATLAGRLRTATGGQQQGKKGEAKGVHAAFVV